MLLMNRTIGTVARMGGVPAIFPEFCDSFIDLVQWNALYLCGPGDEVYYPRPPRISIHDVARNTLVESFRGEWLHMIDSDHAFDPDLTARLMRVADQCCADVVTGLYTFKSEPHFPVLYMQHCGNLMPLADWDRTTTAIEVSAAGAGCLWVRRSVFDRIEAELHEQPFARIGGAGEDISFFMRLERLGIKSVCDPRVECHHLQVRPVSLAHYHADEFDKTERETIRGYR